MCDCLQADYDTLQFSQVFVPVDQVRRSVLTIGQLKSSAVQQALLDGMQLC